MDAFFAEVEGVWGHTLRPHQTEALTAALSGRDVLVTVATGGGKSLVYQALSLRMSPVLVVSPLLALMQDQVHAARQRGLTVMQYGAEGRTIGVDVQLVYATPEAAVRHLCDHKWGAIAIDEAHCVIAWGAQFRPEYAQLAALRGSDAQAAAPVIALTASAPPDMLDAIQASLGMRKPVHVRGSFVRSNLTLHVQSKRKIATTGLSRARRFVDVQNCVQPPCIVYTTTRAEADDIAREFTGMFDVAPYHAGMSDDDRKQVLELFMADELRVVCATVAFARGVDKPNVRTVIHYGPPTSLETYYQGVGRAGRDGEPADCTLLVGAGDWPRLRHANDCDLIALNKVRDFCACDDGACLHQKLVAHFGEETSSCKTRCDVCLNPCTPVDAGAVVTESDTEAAKSMVAAMPYYGMAALARALQGSKKTHDNLKAHASYAAWKHHSEAVCQSGLRSLVRRGELAERKRALRAGGTYVCIVLGKQ